ncbi:serine/threonine-protein kinase PLK4 [Coccinella septempunctata]|uniref:serine/threonine-protein kinase PLK4 n=1 Tax=Coccinella septempunctata TaxID=41139 RepID=UPI001D08F7B2|nr:serine/threonine-protein kinase PLK4 [Coccinella septempunctata]
MNSLNSFGERIEDYEVHNLLGKGGFASVYQAQCYKTHIDVAIKMIDKKLMQAAGMVNRVRQEVAIHSRLKHPSILELYTFFEDANYVYLVLELCHNGELQYYIKKRVLTESEAGNIMKQVVEGMKYLHSHNILHRDISLSNLLLTRDMQVKIADFGLATQLTRADEKHMTMCGTPNFISPEVASRGSHGLEADVWGLGCLLYTLLVGKPPFDTQGVKSTLTRVVMANYEVPSHLSPEAKDLIHSLLQKNPKDRMKLDQILEHPFIRRGHVMSSHITNDSGIHTMSSRRDSAFSDSILPHSYAQPLFPSRRANSDCAPPSHHPVRRLTHSMDQVTNGVQNFDLGPHKDLSCNNGSCHNSCRSQNYERNSRCSYQEPVHLSCHNSNPCNGLANHYQPSDPGGMILGGLTSNRCSPMNSHCADVFNAPRSCHGPNVNDIYNQRVLAASDGGCSGVKPSSRSDERGMSRPELPSPLCSLRLQPTRHQTKNAILSILEDGEVCVEFIKKRGSLKREMVCEILRISPDGVRIVIYEPDGGKGVTPSESPAPLPKQGADQIFSIENLPEKHWKKYMYASKFVDLVRAKTPKVTCYCDRAKSLLMENLTDFEMHFHDGGKVVQSSAEGIVLTDRSGKTFTFKRTEECSNLSGTLEFMWKHAVKMKKHCLLLEESLRRLPGTNFPIIVGRRPSSVAASGKENSPIVAPSFALSINSTNGTNGATSSLGCGKSREKQVAVPGVGTAVQLPNGEVKVRYLDGSQICVDGKNQIKYQGVDGQVIRFSENDKIPRPIMDKLQHMPKVLKHLMSPDVSQKTHSFR